MEQHGAKLPILLAVGCLILLLVGFLKGPGTGALFSKSSDENIQEAIGSQVKEKYIIVVDAGHGGDDPGKIGINKALEKDINLIIAKRLKELLEKKEITVIMTRDSDTGLYQEGDSNKKAADLKNRVTIIENSNADLAVSIHQNSFTEEYVKGAQVFYYTSSEQGKAFAELMQEQIKSSIGDGNHRMAKGDSSYYMLKKTTCPLIIVECGFLSNSAEAALLTTVEYQEKMAQAIYIGIIKYLNQ